MLRGAGYTVDLAEDLAAAREALRSFEYPVAVIDRNLPDGEGLSLVQYAHERSMRVRFLVLSALGDVHRRVEGLNLGADDYLTKPFDREELIARVHAAARRPVPDVRRTWSLGNVTYDGSDRSVRIGGKAIAFTRTEIIILELLFKSAGRIIPRDQIEGMIYGYDDDFNSNTIAPHLSRIRKQLEAEGATITIHASRGIGYLLREL